MIRRIVALVSLAGLLFGSAGAAPNRNISITINGDALPLQPPPRLRGGRLFVPVRRTIDALGLDFNRDSKRIWMHAGAKLAVLTLGSASAELDGAPVPLGAPPREISGVLYVPLAFFTGVLGAQATYDAKASRVTIVAGDIGRSGAAVTVEGNRIQRVGTVSAVDVDSDPPTITLTYNASVKTVPVARNALIDMHDVVANVTVPGELGDVRPGDFARVTMQKNGHVERVEDAYGSLAGDVAAVVADQFVLGDGHVITPGRGTQVTLNGAPAPLADLKAGDRATVRYNVETNEIREVVATRSTSATGSSQAVSISSVDLSTTRPLRAGDAIDVTVHATPHAAATFDIGPYVTDLAMAERSPGVYGASYTIPRGANFAAVPVVAHVRAGGVTSSLSSAQTMSASSTPPGIGDFAPAAGAVVNSRRPAIYATFASGGVPVNPSSVTLRVNGHDVTASCVRNAQFIHYTPVNDYGEGRVTVEVSAADRAGNAMTKTWTFTVKYR